jgi:hypothetical protein
VAEQQHLVALVEVTEQQGVGLRLRRSAFLHLQPQHPHVAPYRATPVRPRENRQPAATPQQTARRRFGARELAELERLQCDRARLSRRRALARSRAALVCVPASPTAVLLPAEHGEVATWFRGDGW